MTPNPTNTPTSAPPAPPRRGVLDWIEWLGNKLPEPSLLFALLALVVVLLSALGSAMEWSVQPVKPVQTSRYCAASSDHATGWLIARMATPMTTEASKASVSSSASTRKA